MEQKVLLLHGALGSKKQLDALRIKLQQSFEVHYLDFDGHGSNLSQSDFSIELFTQNVVDYMNEQAIEKIDVFGYSMGGYVAINTARLYPNRIKNIITLGTKFDWSLNAAQNEVKMLNPEVIEKKVPHFAEKLLTEHTQDWKNVMQKTAALMLGMGEGKKIQDLEFKNINNKVTIGIGSADKMVTIAESQHTCHLLPNATLQVLENVPHPIDKIDTQILTNYIVDSLS